MVEAHRTLLQCVVDVGPIVVVPDLSCPGIRTCLAVIEEDHVRHPAALGLIAPCDLVNQTRRQSRPDYHLDALRWSCAKPAPLRAPFEERRTACFGALLPEEMRHGPITFPLIDEFRLSGHTNELSQTGQQS
jgi:hypothetical protein